MKTEGATTNKLKQFHYVVMKQFCIIGNGTISARTMEEAFMKLTIAAKDDVQVFIRPLS